MSDLPDRSGYAVPHHTHRPVTFIYLCVLQGLPALGVLALGAPSYAIFDLPVPWMELSFTIGALAFILTYLASYPMRYRIAEGLLAPAIWLVLHLIGVV